MLSHNFMVQFLTTSKVIELHFLTSSQFVTERMVDRYISVRYLISGPWFLHCHNELHVEQGMAIVLEVGDSESWPQQETGYMCGTWTGHPQQIRNPNAGIIVYPGGTLILLMAAVIWVM